MINGLRRFSLYSISIAVINSGGFIEMFHFFTCKLMLILNVPRYVYITLSYTVDNERTDFFADAFTTSVLLSWEAISSNNSIMFTYEVEFNIRSDRECCSTNMTTLTDGYIFYINTTETKINIYYRIRI